MTDKISDRTRAFLAGIFILVAYGVLASELTESRTIVMAADVVSGLAVIGIAVLMYPLFRPIGRGVSFSYLFLKLLEGSLMIAAGLFFLTDSMQYLRDWIYNGIHVYVFILSGFIFYFLLFRSKIVPGFIAVWGALGILALLVSTVLNLAGIIYPVIDYFLVLIITNEVFLAVWLMTKGIKRPEKQVLHER